MISMDVSGTYGGKWEVVVTPPSEISKSASRPTEKNGLRELIASFKPLDIEMPKPSPEFNAVLAKYSYVRPTKLRDKLTSGRLGQAMPGDSADDVPEFTPLNWNAEYENVSEDARSAGEALHAAYEMLDFSGISEPGWAEREAERIAGIAKLPDDWDAGRLAESLRGFTSPPLLEIIAGATHEDIWPEQVFSLKIPLSDLLPDSEPAPQPKDWIMLQGRMDLVVVQGKTAWLVDFKSDSVDADSLASHSARHIPQMAAYAEALRRIGGFEVKSFIYYMRRGAVMDVTREVADFDLNNRILDACRIE
jgi:hypothetical protein